MFEIAYLKQYMMVVCYLYGFMLLKTIYGSFFSWFTDNI